MLKLKVVIEDEAWILIDKPARFHTHPPEARELRILPRWNAQGILEKQLGHAVWPSHRLDRATSGLLLYSKDRSWNEKLQRQFAEKTVGKGYFAVVRGTFRNAASLNAGLKNAAGELRPAETLVAPVATFSLPLPHPSGGDRTFTFVRAEPRTGRFHQIRRHLAGAGYPVLGDSRHGDKKLNRGFSALTGCEGLFLRCMELSFRCPRTGARIEATARWGKEWHRLFEFAGVCPLTASPSRGLPSPS